ncbi:MAG: WG repeat-containing protein [Bryobacteraceae bacterium]
MSRLLVVGLLASLGAYGQPRANDHLFPIREGRKFGFINRSGTVVVPAQYDAVAEPSEGRARITMGALSGYVDLEGKVIVEPKYDGTEDFQGGRAVVRKESQYSIIDPSGKLIADIPHRVLGQFHQGLLRVQASGRNDANGKRLPTLYGFVDTSGKLAIPPQFMPAGEFSDDPANLAFGGLDREWVYFDRTGKIIIRVSMGEHLIAANLFSNGRLLVKEGFNWGYKDSSGAWAIPAKYNDAQNFQSGFARVQEGAKWILIDVNGNAVPEDKRKLRPVEPASDGLTLARENDVLGWLDAKDELAFPLRKYEEAHSFFSGRARIKLDGLYGFLDKTGALKIPNAYYSASDFRQGLAFVQTREGVAYIDGDGKTIWKHIDNPKVELK